MPKKHKNRTVSGKSVVNADPFRDQLAIAHRYESEAKLAAAKRLYFEVLAEAPAHADANFRLAALLNQTGEPEMALQYWQRAIEADKDNLYALKGFGDCLKDLHRYEDAVSQYKRAIELFYAHDVKVPDDFKGIVYLHLGLVYDQLEQYELMEKALRKAIQLDPHSSKSYSVLGYMYSVLGDSEEAKACYRDAIRLAPHFGAAHRSLADEKRHAEVDAEVKAMQLLYDAPDTQPYDRAHIAFGLGKAYEDMGQFEKAFEYWREGNRLYREIFPYDVTSTFPVMKKFRKLYKPKLVSEMQVSDIQVTPVFIVGMIRTGSSLVEQMLASHSKVHGAGEIDALYRVTAEGVRVYPDDLAALQAEDWLQLGERYIKEVTKVSAGKLFIIDKALSNYKLIGLIRMMLPHAKIVHCRRDPMDIGLSAFKNIFQPGIQGSSYDLKDIAAVYRHYEKQMKYWHKVLPGWIYDVDYENVVAEPEQTIRGLLAHIGLPFEEACLSFYETRRAIKTASVTQVRQPVYRNSVKGWRRYQKELRPLQRALRRGGWFGL